MEAMIEVFTALSGASTLLVVIQNTGKVTADYLVSVTMYKMTTVYCYIEPVTADLCHSMY